MMRQNRDSNKERVQNSTTNIKITENINQTSSVIAKAIREAMSKEAQRKRKKNKENARLN